MLESQVLEPKGLTDPYKVLDLPLYDLDGSSFKSRDRFGHLCTVTGATWGTQGRTFDGTDDVINCGSPTALDNLGTTGNYKFTVVAWINPASSGENNFGRIFDKAVFRAYMNNSTSVQFTMNVGTVGKAATAAVGSVPYGNNAHIVCVFDGANVIIYTNGTKVTGDATLGPVDNHSALNLLIGNNAGSDRCFEGLIGEVRAYDQIAFNQLDVDRDFLLVNGGVPFHT